ncbi:hypothetical protein BT93_G0761 [Corymbia citriodora subsp. variegata]|nr:hypothetical protein BT93_G0761 [Corymbia citriodora subsp. variegata]
MGDLGDRINVKFDGSNYVLWQPSTMAALVYCDLIEHVEGLCICHAQLKDTEQPKLTSRQLPSVNLTFGHGLLLIEVPGPLYLAFLLMPFAHSLLSPRVQRISRISSLTCLLRLALSVSTNYSRKLPLLLGAFDLSVSFIII